MNVEDFVLKTNIKDIILEEYRTQKKDLNANIADDEYTKQVLKYNEIRAKSRKWHRSGLKNLQFIDVIPEQKVAAQSGANTSTSTSAENDHKPEMSDNAHVKRSSVPNEPNDFQKEIISMDYEAFVNQTNVKELVRKSIEAANEPLTDAAMDSQMKKLYGKRENFRRYHRSLLHHLKMLICECQRYKKFDKKSTQTDSIAIATQDADVQCDSVLQIAASVQSENSCQAKLNMLSVHEISEADIIQIVSSTVSKGKNETTKID